MFDATPFAQLGTIGIIALCLLALVMLLRPLLAELVASRKELVASNHALDGALDRSSQVHEAVLKAINAHTEEIKRTSLDVRSQVNLSANNTKSAIDEARKAGEAFTAKTTADAAADVKTAVNDGIARVIAELATIKDNLKAWQVSDKDRRLAELAITGKLDQALEELRKISSQAQTPTVTVNGAEGA